MHHLDARHVQSVNLIEGFVASVVPPSPTYVNAGDTLKFVTSGGQYVGGRRTVYAIFR
jgi:beta-lactam-binding protein with PASTA domain